MATTFLQKVRLWWRGSQRRREDFVAKNANWTGGQAPSPVRPHEGKARVPVLQIDRDGLQAAYLDQSGAILYYLDLESGDVLESRIELNDPRHARVPTQDDAADRDAFLLVHPVDAKPSFREAIAKDRALERAWYNFKNERAIAAIESWLIRVKSEKC